MGYNDFFNSSFFDDIEESLSLNFNTLIGDPAFRFSSTESVWLPRIIHTEKRILSSHKEVLIRSSFEKKYLPYECEPKPESKYSDEIQLNIDNCEFDAWLVGNSSWELKDKSGKAYKKYMAVCGEPFGAKKYLPIMQIYCQKYQH